MAPPDPERDPEAPRRNSPRRISPPPPPPLPGSPGGGAPSPSIFARIGASLLVPDGGAGPGPGLGPGPGEKDEDEAAAEAAAEAGRFPLLAGAKEISKEGGTASAEAGEGADADAETDTTGTRSSDRAVGFFALGGGGGGSDGSGSGRDAGVAPPQLLPPPLSAHAATPVAGSGFGFGFGRGSRSAAGPGDLSPASASLASPSSTSSSSTSSSSFRPPPSPRFERPGSGYRPPRMEASGHLVAAAGGRRGGGRPLRPPPPQPPPPPPAHGRRIMDRDGNFSQSRGHWKVGNASWLAGGGADGLADGQAGGQWEGGAGSSGRSPPPAGRGGFFPGGSPDGDGDGDGDGNPGRNGGTAPPCCCRCLGAPPAPSTAARLQPSPLRRCWANWYHHLVYTPTFTLMGILFTCYAAIIFLFAMLYLGVSVEASSQGSGTFCNLEITSFTDALYFSLSTMTTIGYGVSDYYFGDCLTPFLMVLCQVFCAIIYDAVAIGLLFTRMSRGQKRGRTIIFSDSACVRRVRGRHYLMFRLGELARGRNIVGATLRVHCVRHERHPAPNGGGGVATTHYQTRHVRLVAPDEDFGSPLLLSLPYVAVHAMEGDGGRSPLVPSGPVWYDREGCARPWPPAASAVPRYGEGANVGESKGGRDGKGNGDGAAMNGDGDVAAVNATRRVGAAGAAGAAAGMLIAGPLLAGAGLAAGAGAAYAAARNRAGSDGKVVEDPKAGEEVETGNEENIADVSFRTMSEVNSYEEESLPPANVWTNEIKSFLADREAELIVLVEGTDEMTGSAVQARHSYRWDDIVFDATFAACVFPRRTQSSQEGEGEDESDQDDSLTRELLRDDVLGRRQRQQSRGGEQDEGSACVIDFSRFHDVVSVPPNSESCPYVPDWA